jgi:hypothetical protein
MSAIYVNGKPVVQSSFPEMTLAQYNALPESERPEFWIRTDASYDSIPGTAVTFDNEGTTIESTDVDGAIKEAYGKSAKSADLTSISQTGSTASQAISAGTYFYLDGTLVRAKTAIASGATFTLNTNYEVVTSGALNDKFNWEVGVAKLIGESYAGKEIYRTMYATGLLGPNAVITLDANLKNIKVLRWGGYINAGNNVFALPYTNVTNIGYDIQVQINSINGLVVICGSNCEASWSGMIWLDYFIP